MSVIIGIFFLVSIVLGSILIATPVVGIALMLLVSFAQVMVIWTGYNSWAHGRSITKDNVQSEIKLALKRG
jgi:hypothetical protein